MIKGDRLRKLRKEKGLNQTELGDLVGVKKSEICLYELEKRNPSLETIVDFITIFGVSADYLLGTDIKAKVFVNSEIINYTLTEEEMTFLEELKKEKLIYDILLDNPYRGIELIKNKIG